MDETVVVNDIEVPSETLLADGLERGLIGYVTPMNSPPLAIYNYNDCVVALMEDNSWGYDDAIEWMEFNVVSAYVGAGTPLFMFDN